MRNKTVGARVLVFDNDKVLLVKHTYMPDWYSVGGGVEKGETPIETVARELMEEVGVQCVEPPKLFNVYHNCVEGRDDYVALYIVKSFTQKRVTSPEILEAKWFSLHALPEDISPATLRRIEEYQGKRALTEKW